MKPHKVEEEVIQSIYMHSKLHLSANSTVVAYQKYPSEVESRNRLAVCMCFAYTKCFALIG